MKKKTWITIIVASLVTVAAIALAPYLYHKPKPVETNIINASNDPVPTVQPVQPSVSNPVYDHQPISRKVLPVNKPKPVIPNHKPHPKTVVQIEKPLPDVKEKPKLKPEDIPQVTERTPVVPGGTDTIKQGEKAESNSGESKTSDKRPSAWGVAVLGNSSGVDAGISYRVLQFSLLKQTDLDLIIGTKQAGIGLSKYISGNLGLGVTGTVAYNSGEKNLGLYGKYSF